MTNAPKKAKATKSIETSHIAQWVSRQISALGWKNYTFENGDLHAEIDHALSTALSKEGGSGGCRVDAKLMISNGAKNIPVMIEYKGKAGALEKLNKHGLVYIKNDKNEYDFKTISKFAVNGAMYYSDVVINHTSFDEVLAIGINGWQDETAKVQYEVKAYILAKTFPNMAILLNQGTDLSFLNNQNLTALFDDIADKQLKPEELHRKHLADEERLDKVLKELNQHLRDESRIQVNHRIAVVTPCIMAGLGVKNEQGEYLVKPLNPDDLRGENGEGDTDGDKIFNRVKQFLKKRNIPEIKRKHIEDSLKQTLLHQRLGLKDERMGISPLKSAYVEVLKNIIPAYHLSGILDFTGKLFNVMNDWVAVPDGDQNDVVLTPRYVTDLMAQFAEVDQNSYVWDWALGSGGFLISAMNLMLADAKRNATSEKVRLEKEAKIKSEQLLGIEKLPDIYILAVLNMILMNDGSTNIINENSLTEYQGTYAYSKEKGNPFPANVFLLNPPYSAPGNGMIFVQKAFEKMKNGKGVVIIQDSAGTGKAAEFNKTILKNNRLLASIKMPADLFKASVQTSIYLFEVGKTHKADDWVKFIDFSEDGYTRTNRKKASTNLADTGNAKARYAELVSVVKNGITPDCQYFKDGKNYVLDKILIERPIETEHNTLVKYKEVFEKFTKLKKSEQGSAEYQRAKANFETAEKAYLAIVQHNEKVGCDWNFTQHKKVELQPSIADFKRTVADYLAWEVSQILKQQIKKP